MIFIFRGCAIVLATIDNNFAAIEAYVKGKTVAELEGILSANSKEQMVDVVGSATLADTHGYVSAIKPIQVILCSKKHLICYVLINNSI
jgi:hypothetical protein